MAPFAALLQYAPKSCSNPYGRYSSFSLLPQGGDGGGGACGTPGGRNPGQAETMSCCRDVTVLVGLLQVLVRPVAMIDRAALSWERWVCRMHAESICVTVAHV